jgi:hypothetical protein
MSMNRSLSSKPYGHLALQYLSRLMRYPSFNFLVTRVFHCLFQISSIKILIFYSFEIYFNIILPLTRNSTKDVFQFVVLYTHLSSASYLLHTQAL